MRRSLLRSAIAAGTAASMVAVAASPPVLAQSYAPPYAQPYAPQTQMLGGPGQSVRLPLAGGQAVQNISLPRGASSTVNFDGPVKSVVVSDPQIAEVLSLTANSYVLMAKQPGRTDVRYFDGAGRVVLTQSVAVQMDISALDQMLTRVTPGARVRSEVIGQNILLSGQVANAAESDLVVRVARTFVTRPENVVNALTISGQEQVRLEVRVVEVNRTVIKQLGFDTKAVFGQLGMDQISIGNSPTYAINGGFQGGGAGGWAMNSTSQPVSGGLGGLFSNLVAIPFGSTGINQATIGQYVQTYLQGGTMTAAQSTYVRDYLAQYAGKVFATDINGVTYTAADLGVNINNLPTYIQAYNSNTSGLSALGNEYLRKFIDTLPSYNNAYGSVTAPNSTFIDRTNPANAVATGRAGNTGLNQGNAMLQAFERQGLVRTIAEPNLTTVSGEGAKFLAGGEYPVPTGRDQAGNTTIEFKPYGVGLGFTPVVLSGGRISLKIAVEVSELTSQGALTLSGVAGAGTSTVIPALQVRRAENVVELSSGGAAQIAGLLQESTRQNIDKVPGVADLPILGALARSRDFLNNETELVIIVNAFLVNQVRPDQLQTPADGLRIASDLETNLLGRLNHAYKAPTEPTITAAQPPRAYEGPIGHVIE